MVYIYIVEKILHVNVISVIVSLCFNVLLTMYNEKYYITLLLDKFDSILYQISEDKYLKIV